MNATGQTNTQDRGLNESILPGDEFIGNPRGQLTDHIDIQASPGQVWPWLVQMGVQRAGFYGAGWPGDEGKRTQEVLPELQGLRVGDAIFTSEDDDERFEVLALEPSRRLVFGHLHDADTGHQISFSARRPPHYWQITWAFLLTPREDGTTRLVVRSRFASSPAGLLQMAWIHPVCRLMRTLPLDVIAARAEGKALARDDHDVLEGLEGAGLMLAALLTPFARGRRGHWGMKSEEAAHPYPGDDLVVTPRWCWTHGIEIEAPASEVWPWIAQIGADRAGFYSYEWLENLAGCEIHPTETIHPQWEVREGDQMQLHPRVPPLRVALVEPGRCWVAHAPADPRARAEGRPWTEASWLFYLEPLGPERCRFVSRYRVNSSFEPMTRLTSGPALLEPIGFVMDRRMLNGVKERAERARRAASAARPLSSGR